MASRVPELPARARIYLTFVVCGLIAAAGWQSLIGPARLDVEVRRDRLARLEEEIRRARQSASERPALDEEVRLLDTRAREWQLVSQHDKDPLGVLTSLRELAAEAGLDLVSFKPGPLIARERFDEWPIELVVEGAYHDFGRFLGGVAALPRLMSVSDLELKSLADEPRRAASRRRAW